MIRRAVVGAVLAAAAVLVAGVVAARAQESVAGAEAERGTAGGVTAFTGARIIPIDGPEIAGGVLVVADGRIVAVGAADAVEVPAGATVVDLAGKVLMPGLVDTHSHVGEPWAADGSEPLQPGVSVLDSINVRDTGFQRARAGGVTTANVMSGSGHLMSGQTAYLKLRGGGTVEEWVIRDAEGRAMGGMKMANGTNSMRDAPFPGTRGKSAALVRALFVKAQAYRDKVERAADDPEKDPEKMPERDLGMEAMLEVLSGRRIVHHHTHRHDDIVTVLRLSEEFGFRVVLHHVSEAWKVADEIAAAGAPCSLILIDSPGGKLEAVDIGFEAGGVLERAGAKVAFHTDDLITDSRLFLRMAALAVRAGMSREEALRALTQNAAEMMDLGDRVGSLTPGKDADFVVLGGDPFSVYTKVEQTWVEGRLVFDRTRDEDRLFAVGGLGAGNPRVTHICCERGEDG